MKIFITLEGAVINLDHVSMVRAARNSDAPTTDAVAKTRSVLVFSNGHFLPLSLPRETVERIISDALAGA